MPLQAGLCSAATGARRERIRNFAFGRTPRRRAISAALLVAGVTLGTDATLIEPYRLEVSRHTVALEKLRAPLVVAHLSDLHSHAFARRERAVVEVLEREKPDLIVITGDLVDGGDLAPAQELLTRLRAPLGVFAVHGNWDNWVPPPDERRILEASGVTLLVNEGARVRPDVFLAGLDDALSGVDDPAKALRGAPADGARIALFHSPAVFDLVAPRVDLALAGHTHGGQVKLPLWGALWTPPGSGPYVEGWYEREHARLFVSRGIGTSVLNVRFWCRPEIAILTLRPP